MRNLILTMAAAVLAAPPALAAPDVNGAVDTGEYGAATASVGTSGGAPLHNFGTPTDLAQAGYDIYLTDTAGSLFGAVVQTGGTTAGTFANLYFDIDPVTGTGGSELGIEVNNKLGFIAGVPNSYFDLSSYIDWKSITVGGVTTTEFSIRNDVFRGFIAGAAAQGYFGPGGYTPQDVRLNLSQSLSYSVAGGASYGTEGLGRFSVAGVPEPATWAMMLVGFGMAGYGIRRRRGAGTHAAA